jgi:hypothetical protein
MRWPGKAATDWLKEDPRATVSLTQSARRIRRFGYMRRISLCGGQSSTHRGGLRDAYTSI